MSQCLPIDQYASVSSASKGAAAPAPPPERQPPMLHRTGYSGIWRQPVPPRRPANGDLVKISNEEFAFLSPRQCMAQACPVEPGVRCSFMNCRRPGGASALGRDDGRVLRRADPATSKARNSPESDSSGQSGRCDSRRRERSRHMLRRSRQTLRVDRFCRGSNIDTRLLPTTQG